MVKKTTETFVGRGAEISQLKALMKQATQGAGSVVIVSGEAGIGKTRLLEHLAAEIKGDEVRYVQESFADSQACEPYSPFIKIAQTLVNSGSPSATASQVEKRETKSPAGHFEGQSTLESLYALQKQQSLAQQHLASSIFEAANLHGTLLIILDDVEAAPLSAWKFIHYLSESVSSKRILLLISVRQEGRQTRQDQVPAYADVMQRMNREGLFEQIKLERFDADEVMQCINATFPVNDFSGGLAKTVQALSNGNPAQIDKFFETALEDGVLYEKNGSWFDQADVGSDHLAELMSGEHELKHAEEAVQALPESQQQLLNFAALLSGPFDHRVLGEITGQSRIKMIKALMALREQHVLTCVKEDVYQFKTPSIRLMFLNGLPAEMQARMHLEIAEKIEAASQLSIAERTGLLAYHYSHTLRTDLALRYRNEAGLLALSNFAFVEAKEHLGRALELLEKSKASNREPHIDILIRLAWLHHVLGFWDKSLELCEQARVLCTEPDELQLEIQLLIQEGLTYFRRNDWKKSQGCFQKALEHESILGKFERAMINYGLGDVHFEIGKYDDARKHFQEALSLARELDKKQLMANILNNLGALENVRCQHLRAIALYSESTAICNSLGDHLGLARIYHNLGMTHAEQKSWRQADEFYGKSLEVSESMGLRPLKSITFLNRALALAKLGRLEEASQYNLKALRLLERLQDELGIAEYHKIQGVIERERDNWTAARTELEKGMDQFETLDNKLGVSETLYELALLAAVVGKHDERENCLRRCASIYRELGLAERAVAIEAETEQREVATVTTPA